MAVRECDECDEDKRKETAAKTGQFSKTPAVSDSPEGITELKGVSSCQQAIATVQ